MAAITQESLFDKFAELDVKTLMVVEVRDKLNDKMRPQFTYGTTRSVRRQII